MRIAGAIAMLMLGLLPCSGIARTACLTDAEIDAAVGDQVRAGAPFVDTSELPQLPLCSGLTLGDQIQRIRAAAFPEEQQRLAEARAAVVAREEDAARGGAGGWQRSPPHPGSVMRWLSWMEPSTSSRSTRNGPKRSLTMANWTCAPGGRNRAEGV